MHGEGSWSVELLGMGIISKNTIWYSLRRDPKLFFCCPLTQKICFSKGIQSGNNEPHSPDMENYITPCDAGQGAIYSTHALMNEHARQSCSNNYAQQIDSHTRTNSRCPPVNFWRNSEGVRKALHVHIQKKETENAESAGLGRKKERKTQPFVVLRYHNKDFKSLWFQEKICFTPRAWSQILWLLSFWNDLWFQHSIVFSYKTHDK